MKLRYVDDPSNGCGYVRAYVPSQALIKRGHEAIVSNGEFVLNANETDAIILGRIAQGNIQGAIMDARREGIKVIYDLDDAVDLVEPSNIVYSVAMTNLSSYFFLLRQADMITVTTEDLANHLRAFVPPNTPIKVLPNCIDPDAWMLRPGRAPGAVPRIGYSASNSHVRDIVPVIEALKRIQKRSSKKRFEFSIFGFSGQLDSFKAWHEANKNATKHAPKTIFRESMLALEKAIDGLEHEWVRARGVTRYMAGLAEMNYDLGICAVRENDFNRYKSCIKVAEYAMAGTDVMMSDARPYNVGIPIGEGSPFVINDFVEHNVDAWETALELWLERVESGQFDPFEAAMAKRAWILEHHDIGKRIHEWEEAYASVIEERAPAPRAAAEEKDPEPAI